MTDDITMAGPHDGYSPRRYKFILKYSAVSDLVFFTTSVEGCGFSSELWRSDGTRRDVFVPSPSQFISSRDICPYVNISFLRW
jgi:hypothetical protein